MIRQLKTLWISVIFWWPQNQQLKHSDLATLTRNGLNFKSNAHSSLVVCASHAMHIPIDRIWNPIIPCKGCGIKPSTGKTATIGVLQIPVVNAYYQQNTEFAETFSESDKICFRCYCFHLQIVNQAPVEKWRLCTKALHQRNRGKHKLQQPWSGCCKSFLASSWYAAQSLGHATSQTSLTVCFLVQRYAPTA